MIGIMGVDTGAIIGRPAFSFLGPTSGSTGPNLAQCFGRQYSKTVINTPTSVRGSLPNAWLGVAKLARGPPVHLRLREKRSGWERGDGRARTTGCRTVFSGSAGSYGAVKHPLVGPAATWSTGTPTIWHPCLPPPGALLVGAPPSARWTLTARRAFAAPGVTGCDQQPVSLRPSAG